MLRFMVLGRSIVLSEEEARRPHTQEAVRPSDTSASQSDGNLQMCHTTSLARQV